ncbi:MAG: ABC transporter substrate-binding protein, partial [Chloroflexota bacterium]|nr:ABC transporter substrate-binding protein [Chloroflexota bacterium]
MTDTRLSDLVQAMNEGRINRRQFIQRALALGVSLPALALALGPGAGAAPASPPRVPSSRSQTDATTLIIADNLAGNWITLDPARIYEVNSQAAMNVVYECLYHLPDSTKADQFEPLLAEAMPDVSADGKVVTIKLRPGVKFHNTGNEMTSADWIYSWNRLKAVADNPSFLAEYVGTYEAVDPLTL